MHVLDNIPIDRISFLFGSAKLTRYYNFVILYAKYFIYSVKMKEGRLDKNIFKHSLEQISRIENYIAIRKNAFMLFLDRWRNVIIRLFVIVHKCIIIVLYLCALD